MNAIVETATTSSHPLVRLNRDLETRAEQFRMVLPKHIPPDKFQRTIMTAVQSDPALINVDRQSLMLACMRCAQDGLLPDKREAALVVFKENRKVDGQWVQRELAAYIPMAFGVRKKILQSEQVADITTNVVYAAEVERGAFIYEEGSARALRHRPLLDLKPEEATDDKIVAAYSMATMKDGTVSYEVMRRFEIDRVRETSQTGATRDKKGQVRTPKGPWVDWFPEMAKKSVLKRHSKVLPQSGDILLDLHDDDEAQGSAAESTIALLDSHEADAPRVIEDRSEDPPHDPETGELHEDKPEGDSNTDEASGTAREAPSAAESTAAKRTKGGASKDGPASDTPREQAQPSDDRSHFEKMREKAGFDKPEPSDEPAGEAEADDDGDDPAAKAAQGWCEAFERAETIIDLEKRWKLAGPDMKVMNEDLQAMVERSYETAKKKLKGEG